MEKFIPFAKLSKREQREINRRARAGWGPLNPVTRKAKNPKAYDRNKARKRNDDAFDSGLCCVLASRSIALSARLW